GKLAAISGVQVPEGFCVTTKAYQKALESNKAFHTLLDQLKVLNIEESHQIGAISRKIRKIITEVCIPSDVEKAVAESLSRFGDNEAYAVRSSATAEDLPSASFAGQHDTFLNVIGKESILQP